MGVSVHHAGHDGATRYFDHLVGGSADLGRGAAAAHLGDPVIVDQDPPGVLHRALVVDGDHRAAVEEGGGHQGAQPAKPSMTGTMSSMSG